MNNELKFGVSLSEIDECIDGDTLITTPSGQVKISDISIGHEIISYDITNNEFEIDVVEKVFENNSDVLEMVYRKNMKMIDQFIKDLKDLKTFEPLMNQVPYTDDYEMEIVESKFGEYIKEGQLNDLIKTFQKEMW